MSTSETTGETSPVCAKCGWYTARYSAHHCDEKAGHVANEIAQIARSRFVPPVESTKLGYGNGRLTFEISDDVHLTVKPNKTGTFSIENLFAIGNVTQDELLRLVDVLRGFGK